LAFSSFSGVYSYRRLARSISYRRATELRLAWEIFSDLNKLQSIISRAGRTEDIPTSPIDSLELREEFRKRCLAIEDRLAGYKAQLREFELEQKRDADSEDRLAEWQTIREIERSLERIAKLNDDDDWALHEVPVEALDSALVESQNRTMKLTFHMQKRMGQIVDEVRGQYRFWIILTWTSTVFAGVMVLALLQFLRRAIFKPLQILIQGSRRVARDGDFNHRIQLDTHDEVTELAGAMNAMTDRFQRIRDELDHEIKERDELVRQRTKEVVRSEQLAGVGFLAAGVAHEINNPMAAIAWAAESLEMRLHDIIQEDDAKSDEEHNEEITVLRTYLRTIQDEAFRCKGITSRLLDFSRMGDVEKQDTDFCELVQDVIDMVRHLGKYRRKNIEFDTQQHVIARVNSQEIRQVVLNLITNALDNLDPDGTVAICLRKIDGQAELMVSDNGCGMTSEVMQHLFEPFFTRRRDGQGTGLGLSITYRIVQDHGGDIVPSSDGPGRGSQFRVTLPLTAKDDEQNQERQKVA
jgi:signal transduction histidine kinase